MSEKKEFVPKEEIEKLKVETEKQLNHARQQAILCNKKVEQLIGSLAMCNVILKKADEKEKK